ncbi:MAG: hypothetical protein WBG67_02115 [Thermoanaerobaculia bacterium]
MNLALGLLLVAGFVFGCTRREYSVIAWNKTAEEVRDFTVFFDGRGLLGGGVVPGGRKGYGYVQLPLPKTATVKWMAPDGSAHEREVDVEKWIKRESNFKGTLNFVVNPDLSVSFVPVRDRNSTVVYSRLLNASSGKSLEPKEPI